MKSYLCDFGIKKKSLSYNIGTFNKLPLSKYRLGYSIPIYEGDGCSDAALQESLDHPSRQAIAFPRPDFAESYFNGVLIRISETSDGASLVRKH